MTQAQTLELHQSRQWKDSVLTPHALNGSTIQVKLFNAFVTCYVWRVHAGSKGTVWQLSFTSSSAWLMKIRCIFYTTVDTTTETVPQDTAGFLCVVSSLCAALVFSSSSLWAAGCVYVFLCRQHCSLPLKRLHVVVCSFLHSSLCN